MKKHKRYQIPDHVTDIILESISDGVFTVDKEWRITSFNHAAEEITGIRRDEAIGKECREVFRSNICEKSCALRRTMKEGKRFVDTSAYIVNSQRRPIPVVVSTSLLKRIFQGYFGQKGFLINRLRLLCGLMCSH